jgi:hypothetical protein
MTTGDRRLLKHGTYNATELASLPVTAAYL